MARVFGAHRRRAVFWMGVPAVVCVACLLLGVQMVRDEDFAAVGHVLLAIGLGSAVIAVLVLVLGRYRVVIGDDGIRIRGPRSLDLGAPKKLRCGQYETTVVAPITTPWVTGRVPVPQKHVWVAVEGQDGQQVVFHASRGMLHKNLGWPAGRPPVSDHVFYGDVIKLRDAIGEQIR